MADGVQHLLTKISGQIDRVGAKFPIFSRYVVLVDLRVTRRKKFN